MKNPPANHFIYNKISKDAEAGMEICTRFPPEPNGHLHIGHAKAIWLNFEMARAFDGRCCLRLDDTNPETESDEHVDAITRDMRWLGYHSDTPPKHTSDYFEALYQYAVQLIESEKAYICDLSREDMREMRGNYTTPGQPSAGRDRSIADNLALFARMRAGEFDSGAMSLRARIDMNSPNLYLRDPVLYRIRHSAHHRTGSTWCIYPTYDFAHCLSDVIEGISHSLCTLEFEEHRPLYDFLVDSIELPEGSNRPRQTEFSRLQLDYTITSKRKLAQLINEHVVDGWDDPRLPTLAGMRRRGYPPQAILELCSKVGVTRQQAWTDLSFLEGCVRDALADCNRAMAVLRPLRVVLTNLDAGYERPIQAPLHPKDEDRGERTLLLQNEVYIERDDFALEPPKGYFRLCPGGEVRLRLAGVIRYQKHDCDKDGNPTTVYCEYLGEVEHKVKGVVHWVPANKCVVAQVRLYDRLFSQQQPDDMDLHSALNPNSLETLEGALLEPSLADCPATTVQFERLGYFCTDSQADPAHSVWNRVVTLRDTWSAKK